MKIANIYNLIHKTVFVTGLSALMTLTSCRDEGLISENIWGYELGEDEFVISVPVKLANAEQRTRGHFAVSTEEVSINSIWVGVFDSSGNMVGSVKTDNLEINPSKPSHTESAGSVKIKCNGFNDVGTNTYQIAAIANYDDVYGFLNPQEEAQPISKLIDNVRSWADYISIIADVSTIEGKQSEIFMSGLYSEGHVNSTVDSYGKVYGNNDNNIGLTFSPDIQYENYYKHFELNDRGFVHLRPLVSHARVNLTFGPGLSVSNVQWRLGNIPKYTFVQERKTVENMGELSSEEYYKRTPAASDLFGNGYAQTDFGNNSEFNPLQNDEDKSYHQVSARCNNNPHPEEDEKIDDNTYRFGFWHYDNKHWGLESCDKYGTREIVNEGKIYSSLCSEDNNGLNNNASYFIIKAHIKDGSGREGDCEFLIHEGYACKPNGDSSKSSSPNNPEDEALKTASRDFSMFRNTDYTYNVKINGMEDIIVKVTKDDNSNPGATGTVWGNIEDVATRNVGQIFKINLEKGDNIEWLIYNGNEYFGDFSSDSKIADIVNGKNLSDINTNDDFYKGIIIRHGNNEFELYQFLAPTDGEYEVEIPQNGTSKTRILYVTTELSTPDQSSRYISTFAFTQDGSKLDSPFINNEKYGEDESMQPEFRAGLGNSTIYWENTSANSYTLRIKNKEGVQQGQDIIVDGKEFDGLDDCSYSFSFATIHALADGDYILEIIANSNDPAVSSSVASIYPFTISGHPNYNFNNSNWRTIIAEAVATDDYEGGRNGLTIIRGNGSMTAVYSDNTNTVDKIVGIQTGGAGSKTKRCFTFKAYQAGTIKVTSSNTNATAAMDRMVCVEVGENDTNPQQKAGGYAKPNNLTNLNLTPIEFPIEPEATGSNIYIYTSANLNIYSILFVPSN